jgi:chromate reductase, NAD(P)H dehydrogenase (quinone)
VTTPKILAFAGSTRKDSWNKKLVRVAAAAAQDAGADVTTIDLRDYPLPLYDGDLEKEDGLPENVVKMKQLFLEHDGLLIASPEFNGSLTAVLKNTIDWVSRPAEGESALACFDNKVAAIMSTSPGGLGGLRGLTHLRTILAGIGVMVLPNQLAVAKAFDAFVDDGSMKETKQQESVMALGSRLARILQQLGV